MVKSEIENRRLLIWGLATIFALMILCGSAIIVSWQWSRAIAQFPGSELVADHSKYNLPKLYRWDDTYATQAPVDQVYAWYSITFALGPERQANGSCSLLEDVKSNFLAERYFGVLICEMGEERMMFVTRATKFFP